MVLGPVSLTRKEFFVQVCGPPLDLRVRDGGTNVVHAPFWWPLVSGRDLSPSNSVEFERFELSFNWPDTGSHGGGVLSCPFN